MNDRAFLKRLFKWHFVSHKKHFNIDFQRELNVAGVKVYINFERHLLKQTFPT